MIVIFVKRNFLSAIYKTFDIKFIKIEIS